MKGLFQCPPRASPWVFRTQVCRPVRAKALLFHEDEIYGSDEADECGKVIPMQALPLEEDVGDDGEDDERHALLYHFELYQIEWTAVVDESDAVGWYLAAVFEEGDRPAEGDDSDERPVAAGARLLEFEMSIPCERHEDVAQHEEQDSVYSVHIL